MSDKLVEDEVEDGNHKADPGDHPMLLVDLLQVNSMVMSTDRLGVHVGLDGLSDEEEGRKEVENCDVEYPNDDEVGEDGSIVIVPSRG